MEQNLSLYYVFHTVAKKGSISHAAKELYISQPAISKSIQKLEDNLNTTLFKRSSRGPQYLFPVLLQALLPHSRGSRGADNVPGYKFP